VFPQVSGLFLLWVLTKPPKVLTAAYRFWCGKHSERTKKDGSSSYMVLWRDPKSREQQGITVPSLVEAETLKRLLDANGQSFETAQHAILSNEKRTPTVAEVIQEHIDLPIRRAEPRRLTRRWWICISGTSSATCLWINSITG
jgi:hypothetical protein